MNYKRKELNNIVLHTIKTDAFKTITIDIYFRRKANIEEYLASYFMLRLLEYSTKKYDYKSLIERKEDLYNLKLYTTSNIEPTKYRNDILTIKFIAPKYSYENIEEDVFDLIREVIFNNNLENEEYYQEIKTIINNELLSVKNNRKKYAYLKMLENMEPNETISYPIIGRIEDMENCTLDKVKNNYKDLIDNSQIDIVVVGNIEEEKYKEVFSNMFSSGKRFENINFEKYLINNKEKEVFIEEKGLNQNKLCVGLRILNFDYQNEEFISFLYKTILGSGTSSKLFVEVREKNSLTYYASAKFITPSLIALEFGIDRNNYNKALELIKKTIKDMENVSEEELEIAKKTLISNSKDIEYNSKLISSNYYKKENNVNYTYDINEMIKKINNVKANEINEFAKKVYVDTILLYGENYE